MPLSSSASEKAILVFGDSLSAGYGLEKGREWPALMQQKLKQEGFDYIVINHSISGETTGGGLSRFTDSLQQSSPAIVILGLGANDGLRGLSLDNMKTNLQDMINLAQEHNIKVLLAGMHIPQNYGAVYSELFHKQFVTLAANNQVAFLPFLLDNIGIGTEMFQADGKHPNAAAQPQIMQNVWQVLEPVLR